MITRAFIGNTELYWDGGNTIILRDHRKKIVDCVFIKGKVTPLAAGKTMEEFENRLMCIAEIK